MAQSYKVLGQSNPAANSATTLYTVPGSTSTVISSLTICNQAAAAATFTIAIRIGGAALTAAQYISYASNINANDTIVLTLGITLAATDVITVLSSTATMSFNAFGSEIT